MVKRNPAKARAMPGAPFASRLTAEATTTRQALLKRLSKRLNMQFVSFFTSFRYPVLIETGDADMIEDVLQHTDLSKGLCLVLNSPGGDALAAERIVKVCRTYSSDNFSVLVPRRAKSAATMIALGSSKLWMGETSELGPIDTQVVRIRDGAPQYYSAYSIIKSYDELMKRAENTEGNVAPFLQQLDEFDAAEIEELRKSLELARDIAVRWLSTGMMAEYTRKEISRRIQVFLNPERTKSHGRGIYVQETQQAGLRVELIPKTDQTWHLVSELFERTDGFVSTQASKVVESSQYNFAIGAPLERPEQVTATEKE